MKRIGLIILLCVLGSAGKANPSDETDDAGADSVPAVVSGGLPVGTAGAPLKTTPQVYGNLQVHFRHAFATGSDGLVDYDDFRVQRVRLGVKGDVLPWLSYVVELDPRAPQIQSVMRDAFLKLKIIPKHQIRIGQQKTQFGYENNESSTRLFAVNRTEVSDNLCRGKNLRDIGVGILGSIRLAKGFRIEDAVTVVNGAGMNVQNDDTPNKDVWGRLGLRYKQKGSWVRLGFSVGVGDHVDPGDDSLNPADDFILKFQRMGADIEADCRWVFVSAEVVNGIDRYKGEQDELLGYYVNLVGKTSVPVGPIVRYDALGEDFKRWTLGVYYGDPDARFRVLLNYELRQTVEDALKHIGRGDDKFYVWSQVKF